jgi:hypothetical protein
VVNKQTGDGDGSANIDGAAPEFLINIIPLRLRLIGMPHARCQTHPDSCVRVCLEFTSAPLSASYPFSAAHDSGVRPSVLGAHVGALLEESHAAISSSPVTTFYHERKKLS